VLVSTGTLIRNWPVLSQSIAPLLLALETEGRPLRTWSVSSLPIPEAIGNAVAVVAACHHRGGSARPGIRAFASVPAAHRASPVSFSRNHLRGVPAHVRSGHFSRSTDHWIPALSLAEQVLLGDPSQPVDALTVTGSPSDTSPPKEVLKRVRAGGLVIDTAGHLTETSGLQLQIEDFGWRVYQKLDPAEHDVIAPCHQEAELVTLRDSQIRAELVVRHVPLAYSLARRFFGRGESHEDLEQVALAALAAAGSRYQPDAEVAFATFATKSILGELKRHFRDRTWAVRPPRKVQEQYLAVKAAREDLGHDLRASPTIAQIANHLGIGDEEVLEAMEAGESFWVDAVRTKPDPDSGIFDPPAAENNIERTLERHALSSAMPHLAPRERYVLKRVFFDGCSQQEVALDLGLSQMQVSRVVAATTAKL
jgi:RNA polymerase sigma-B factor